MEIKLFKNNNTHVYKLSLSYALEIMCSLNTFSGCCRRRIVSDFDINTVDSGSQSTRSYHYGIEIFTITHHYHSDPVDYLLSML